MGLSFQNEGPSPFLIQAKVRQAGPAKRSGHTFCTHLNLRNRSHRFHPPQHRNPRLPEHVLDFGFL